MGTLDEHWCSVCRKKLDKQEDVYLEFEVVAAKKKKKFPISLKKKKLKGNICSECVEKNPELKKSVEIMIKAGNPNFTPAIICMNRDTCADFKSPEKKQGIDCSHICVIGDNLYCNRSHVGSLKIPREKAEVQREEARVMKSMLEKYIKDPKIKELLNTVLLEKETLQTIYVPPSVVVEDEKTST